MAARLHPKQKNPNKKGKLQASRRSHSTEAPQPEAAGSGRRQQTIEQPAHVGISAHGHASPRPPSSDEGIARKRNTAGRHNDRSRRRDRAVVTPGGNT